MKLPFVSRHFHETVVAGLLGMIERRNETISTMRKTADRANMEKRQIGAALNEALKERDTLQARLDALTPARREDGRFVAKAQRLQPASPPSGATSYGLEDFA